LKSANRACADGEHRDGLTCRIRPPSVRAASSFKHVLSFITRGKRAHDPAPPLFSFLLLTSSRHTQGRPACPHRRQGRALLRVLVVGARHVGRVTRSIGCRVEGRGMGHGEGLCPGEAGGLGEEGVLLHLPRASRHAGSLHMERHFSRFNACYNTTASVNTVHSSQALEMHLGPSYAWTEEDCTQGSRTSFVPLHPSRRSGSRVRSPLSKECVCVPRCPGRFSFFLSTFSATCSRATCAQQHEQKENQHTRGRVRTKHAHTYAQAEVIAQGQAQPCTAPRVSPVSAIQGQEETRMD
jgi:hypothetical protein